MTFWLALALTALMGVSLGLLGGGGSTLAVPILVHVLGFGAHSAIALSLVLVGSTALLAAGFHHRTNPLPFREIFLLAACGAPFSIVGGVVSRQINGALLLLAFGLLLLVMGVLMFRPRPEATESPRRHWPPIVAAGAAVGFLTGFLGVGGGFMVVPALVLLLHMPIKRAVGASLLVIALNSAVAIVGHWSSLEMNLGLILPLLAAALGGTFFGVELCQRFHPPYLRRAFAVFILVIGIFMLVRNLPAFSPFQETESLIPPVTATKTCSLYLSLREGPKSVDNPVTFGDPFTVSAITINFVSADTHEPLVPDKVDVFYIWNWLEYPYPEHSWGAWSNAYDIIQCEPINTPRLVIPSRTVLPRGWYKGFYTWFPWP